MASTLPLSKEQFEPLIPHSGAMCLIDRVDDWNENSILCASSSHQNPHNPLRLDGELSSMHLLEYGAQAMAIHGGLLTGIASPGVLVAVRDVKFYIDTLDPINEEIVIRANAEMNIASGASYQFSITDVSGNLLLSARATVINNWEQTA